MAKIFYIDDQELPLSSTSMLLENYPGRKPEDEPLSVDTMKAHPECMKEAVSQAMKADLVITDYDWGNAKENGVGLAEKLRQEGYHKPIILLTGTPEREIRARHANMQGLEMIVVSKPPKSSALYELIQTALKSPEQGAGAQAGVGM